MSNKFDGPLSYLGVVSSTPPNFNVFDRAPLSTDYKSFKLGDIWLEKGTENTWILTSIAGSSATWSASTSATGGFISTITGDVSDVMPVANNVNIIGGTNIVTTGDGSDTLTIDTANDITISGTLTADSLSITNAIGFDDTVTINSGGLDVTGTITFDDLDAGVMVTDSSGIVSSIPGSVGQVLISGGSGVSPSFGNITSSGGTINITAVSGYINLEATGSSIISINNQTDSYQLLLEDLNKIVIITKGSAVNLTVPTNASAAFPVGSQIVIAQGGTGQVTVVAEDAITVTINSAGSRTKLYEQYSTAILVQTAANEWLLTGDITS